MSLFESRVAYKPLAYPWAYDAFMLQNKVLWLPEEVPMAEDIKDWNQNLTAPEKNLLESIMRFFVQSDVEVSKSYHTIYAQWFKPTEVCMMLNAFNNMEGIHIAAYAHLIDTLGLPESEYNAFMEYRETKEKWEFLQNYFDPKNKTELALSMAVFGAFTEGLQLFASFAMLLNFQRFNHMKGMCQIVTWSIRDETMHCENIIKLFHTMLQENPGIDTPEFRATVRQACRDIVSHEDAFIDMAFALGPVKGMSAEDTKGYIRYVADRRLLQLGMAPEYGQKTNPCEWLDEILNAVEHVNFFEQRGTEYSKAATSGTWEDAWAKRDAAKKKQGETWLVYSKSNCPHCVTAKKLLQGRGYAYEEINLDDDMARQEFYANHQARSMPQVYHNGVKVGGADDLARYLRGINLPALA